MGLNEIAEFKHLEQAGLKCCRGGRWKLSIQTFEMKLTRYSAKARIKLLTHSFRPYKTNDFPIYERGKLRKVRAHTVYDRQIYKSFCEYELKPATKNYILDNNNASQKNKGTDRSIKQFRQDLAHAYKKYGRDFYVITYDYHDYFGSLDHAYINEDIQLSYDTQWILIGYTELFSRMDGRYVGVGIGGEPSQDIAVVYPSKIHRTIACDPRVLGSGSYMDDGYAICHTKEEAQIILTKIVAKSNECHLQLNWKRTKIFWMEKDTVIWLKKRTHLTPSGKIIMKVMRENIRAEIKRLKEARYLIDHGTMPRRSIDQSIACWAQYTRPYNSNMSRYRVIKYYANLFDVPWDQAKILLRRHAKGWLKDNGKST